MTPLQYERWKEFSLNMARGYPHTTEARRSKLIAQMEFWFSMREDDFASIEDWDANVGDFYVGDEVTEAFDRFYHNKFSTAEPRANRFLEQIQCCIRAGFDVAVRQSGGVLGFTVGDLRSWFWGQIPYWIADQFDGLRGAADTEGVWL